jgi:hypothetical protein
MTGSQNENCCHEAVPPSLRSADAHHRLAGPPVTWPAYALQLRFDSPENPVLLLSAFCLKYEQSQCREGEEITSEAGASNRRESNSRAE